MWAVDGEVTGDWNWPQPEEDKPEGSIGSVEKAKETINIDEEGYDEEVRRPRQRTIEQFMRRFPPWRLRRLEKVRRRK